MPNWLAVPAPVLELMTGTPPMVTVGAIASTVLSHVDGCDCTLCAWWHDDTPEPVHVAGCLGNHLGDCAVSGLFG